MSTQTRTSFVRPAVRGALRYGYAPLLLVGVNGAGVALAAARGSEVWLVALIVGAVGLSFLAERVIPYRDDWNTSHDDAGRDTVHAFVNETLTLAGVVAIPVLASVAAVVDVWPRSWPFVVQVLAAILVADVGITLTHFASHKIGVLWRFHAVHHSVKRFYGFNGLTKHPLHQMVEIAGATTPLILIGLPVEVACALALAAAVQLLLQHSNADYRVGPLRYILALNEAHRFHHLKWPRVGDVNFGLFTLIWDRVLGTFSFDPHRGFTSDDLGMAAKPDYPSRYLDQIREPFQPTRPRESPQIRPAR